jgi:hypothetical protein
MNNTAMRVNERAEETQKPHHATPAEYAANKIQNKSQDAVNKTAHHLSHPIQKARKNIDRAKKHFHEIKNIFKETSKSAVKTAQKSVKTAKTSIKTAQQTAKAAQKTAQAAAKSAKAAEKAVRASAKAAVQATEITAKAVIATVKTTIAAVKGLSAAIAAGGWVAVAIILIVCMVALLLGSVYSIFLANDPNPDTGMTLNNIVAEIDTEHKNMINEIIATNYHDILDISEKQPEWKQVLAIYAVETVKDPNNSMEVFTMNIEKANILRTIFWDMNTITYTLETMETNEDLIDDYGFSMGESNVVTKTILNITIINKTSEEIAEKYDFNDEQKTWLAEISQPEYNDLWNSLLFGINQMY